jgi:hypothetical protein
MWLSGRVPLRRTGGIFRIKRPGRPGMKPGDISMSKVIRGAETIPARPVVIGYLSRHYWRLDRSLVQAAAIGPDVQLTEHEVEIVRFHTARMHMENNILPQDLILKLELCWKGRSTTPAMTQYEARKASPLDLALSVTEVVSIDHPRGSSIYPSSKP